MKRARLRILAAALYAIGAILCVTAAVRVSDAVGAEVRRHVIVVTIIESDHADYDCRLWGSKAFHNETIGGCAKQTGGWQFHPDAPPIATCQMIVPEFDAEDYNSEIHRIWGHEATHCTDGRWH